MERAADFFSVQENTTLVVAPCWDRSAEGKIVSQKKSNGRYRHRVTVPSDALTLKTEDFTKLPLGTGLTRWH